MRRILPALLLLLFMPLLASCVVIIDADDDDDDDIRARGTILGPRWVLVVLDVDGTIYTVRGRTYSLTFQDDGTFGGTSDCNDYWGGYVLLRSGGLQVDEMASTDALCAQGTLDGLYQDVLTRVVAYDRFDGELTLTTANGDQLVYRED